MKIITLGNVRWYDVAIHFVPMIVVAMCSGITLGILFFVIDPVDLFEFTVRVIGEIIKVIERIVK